MKGVVEVLGLGRCPMRHKCGHYRDNDTCNVGPFEYCGQYRALNGERKIRAIPV